MFCWTDKIFRFDYTALVKKIESKSVENWQSQANVLISRIFLNILFAELILSKTVVFFYEAHEPCDKKSLESKWICTNQTRLLRIYILACFLSAHFSPFGQIFRAYHIPNEDFQTYKPYGNYLSDLILRRLMLMIPYNSFRFCRLCWWRISFKSHNCGKTNAY